MDTFLFIDGAARNHTGAAACSYVLADAQGNRLTYGGWFLGESTDLKAVYTACIWGLRNALARNVTSLLAFSDSQPLVAQVDGSEDADADVADLLTEAKSLIEQFESFSLARIQRSENKQASRYMTEALISHTFVGYFDVDPFGSPDMPDAPSRTSGRSFSLPTIDQVVNANAISSVINDDYLDRPGTYRLTVKHRLAIAADRYEAPRTWSVEARVATREIGEDGRMYASDDLTNDLVGICAQFDGKQLDRVPPFDRLPATMEHLVRVIYWDLEEKLPDNVQLDEVAVWSNQVGAKVSYRCDEAPRASDYVPEPEPEPEPEPKPESIAVLEQPIEQPIEDVATIEVEEESFRIENDFERDERETSSAGVLDQDEPDTKSETELHESESGFDSESTRELETGLDSDAEQDDQDEPATDEAEEDEAPTSAVEPELEPEIEQAPEAETEAEAEAEIEIPIEPEPECEDEVTPENEEGLEPQSDPEIVIELEPEPATEPEPAPETEFGTDFVPESVSEITAEPESEPEPNRPSEEEPDSTAIEEPVEADALMAQLEEPATTIASHATSRYEFVSNETRRNEDFDLDFVDVDIEEPLIDDLFITPDSLEPQTEDASSVVTNGETIGHEEPELDFSFLMEGPAVNSQSANEPEVITDADEEQENHIEAPPIDPELKDETPSSKAAAPEFDFDYVLSARPDIPAVQYATPPAFEPAVGYARTPETTFEDLSFDFDFADEEPEPAVLILEPEELEIEVSVNDDEETIQAADPEQEEASEPVSEGQHGARPEQVKPQANQQFQPTPAAPIQDHSLSELESLYELVDLTPTKPKHGANQTMSSSAEAEVDSAKRAKHGLDPLPTELDQLPDGFLEMLKATHYPR